MKFLIDTNIVIPMELTSPLDVEINTPLALEFHKLAANSGSQIFIHPSIKHDLERDTNRDRANIRRNALNRFNMLQLSSPSCLLNVEVPKKSGTI